MAMIPALGGIEVIIMRALFRSSFVLSMFVVLAGCGGSDVDPDGGAVVPDSGAEVLEDAGESADAAVPVDAPAEPDAFVPADAGGPAASVVWTTEVEPRTVDSDIALDFFLQYELSIDGDPFVYGLTLEICIEIAGHAEECHTQPRSNLPGASGVRWGVDPSMYAIGENHYRFRLLLDRDGETVDEDLLDMRIDVTDCTDCVGGPGA
jgi:hypothetical protein